MESFGRSIPQYHTKYHSYLPKRILVWVCILLVLTKDCLALCGFVVGFFFYFFCCAVLRIYLCLETPCSFQTSPTRRSSPFSLSVLFILYFQGRISTEIHMISFILYQCSLANSIAICHAIAWLALGE